MRNIPTTNWGVRTPQSNTWGTRTKIDYLIQEAL